MGRKHKSSPAVSASALAQMGVCERRMVFEYLEGRRLTEAQKAALRRGVRAHRRFAAEDRSRPESSGRCFIATQVFGEGHETQVLRRFRDRVLRSTSLGRTLILEHYRLAPAVCRGMQLRPVLANAARAVLMLIVWLARRLGEMRGDGHGD